MLVLASCLDIPNGLLCRHTRQKTECKRPQSFKYFWIHKAGRLHGCHMEGKLKRYLFAEVAQIPTEVFPLLPT